MAAVSVTAPEDVTVIDKISTVTRRQVGEAVTQLMPVYQDSSDRKFYKAINTSAAAAAATGLTLSPAGTDEYAFVLEGASWTVIAGTGAALTVGERYYVDSTAGLLIPSGDLANPDYITLVAIALTTDTLKTVFSASGVQVP